MYETDRGAVRPAPKRAIEAYGDLDRRVATAVPAVGTTTGSAVGPATVPPPRGATVTHPDPVKLAIIAGDPVTGQGAVAFLRSRPEVDILTSERQREAEVVLILVSRFTEETVAWVQHAAKTAEGDVRFVIVGDDMREHHMQRTVAHGPVSVLSRQDSDYERILRAVQAVREGRLEMPEVALGWLVQQIRRIQRDVLGPKGLTSSGLETREIDVLRLLAEGLNTEEVALRLNYSERTVKNIIQAMLNRLGFRTRAQAVAYALRNGAM